MKRYAALLLAALVAATASTAAIAADIGVVGLFPGKAVLIVDGGAPKTYAVGSTIGEGMRLVAADGNTATVEVGGKRQVLAIGQYVQRSAGGNGGGSVTLQATDGGHFVAHGQINGVAATMLVDTGASVVSIPASEAIRMGINFRNGRRGYANTANGVVNVYQVQLDTVKVGDVELHQVEASVQESGLPIILLGMSFLNRMEMRRSGEQMVLTKRY